MAPESTADRASGALTFFFSDIEGSTKLASALPEAFPSLLAEHRHIVRAAFAAHGGGEVSTAGDSFFAVFPSPTGAVRAAAEIQRALARPLAAGAEIRIRVGLHTGHAVRVGDDYLGLDVHRAARIADAGHGGQVLVSETTRSALGASLPDGLGLVDLGRHRLKDIGPERLWQLAGPGLAAGPFAPPRSLEAHPTNLPADVSPLVDRRAEVAEVAELVRSSSVVTIVGAGGIGKTRLAVEVARSLVSSFPDGVFHLDLAAIPGADLAAASLVEVMGLPISDQRPVEILLDRLRSRDLLVVLDTADRVADLPRLIASIAGTCPRIRILITSRSPLHVAAEREFVLAPLDPASATLLFAARASAVQSGFVLDPPTRSAVERLVARLDGIPLAIELAAARVRLLTPAALLDRLERRLPALGEGARDLPDRQRTLRDTIAWSFELLGSAEQSLFAQVGAFAGAFDIASLEAIATVPDGGDQVSLLERLVDRSLVVTEPAGGEPRFRLLAPIREFAFETLRASGAEEDVRERHARYWLRYVGEQREALERPDDFAAVAALRAAEAEIRGALEWSLATATEAGAAQTTPRERSGPHAPRRAALGLELAGLLGRYWWIRGRVHEGSSWLERALSAAPETDTPERTRALYWAGVLLDDARRPNEAVERLEAALALQREHGDEAATARTLNSLGVVARSLGDLERAEVFFSESVERKRRLGDQAGIAVSVSNLGLLASDRGDQVQAAALMAEALRIDESIGVESAVTLSCANLGTTLIRAGRLEDGLQQLRRALPGIAELEDPELIAGALAGLARARLGSSEPGAIAEAARLLFGAEIVRERARIPLRPIEREEVDEILSEVERRLDAETLASIRADASAIDAEAALALARSAARIS